MNNRQNTSPNKTILRLLTEAFEQDDAKKLEQLIDEHPMLDNEFKMGSQTPLVVYAADHGSEQALRLLIKKGFDIKSTSTDTRNALVSCSSLNPYFPRYEERVRMASLLLSQGLDVNISTSMGSTALQMAALGKLTELVKLLIDKGASVNHVDYVNRTALELIYDQRTASEDVVGALVDAGSSIPEQYEQLVYEHYVSDVLTRVGMFKAAHRIVIDYIHDEKPQKTSRRALD